MALRKALLQVDRDRIRSGPQFEFGRVEGWLAERRTGVVRESVLFERQAEPVHVERAVAVEVLKQLDGIGARLDALKRDDRLTRFCRDAAVDHRIGAAEGLGLTRGKNEAQVAAAPRSLLHLDDQWCKRGRSH